MSNKQLHTLASDAANLIREVNGTMVLSATDAASLTTKLSELAARPDLRHAVESLVDLAQHLDSLGASDASRLLIEVATSAIPALNKQNVARAEVSREAGSKRFDTFMGTAQRAPHFGERADNKTVRLSALGPQIFR